jgi:eukaryotic-like serine/threonine-protein kinase
LDRLVAIKVLAPHLASDPTARQRFVREARAAAAVVHEHVVTVHAVQEADPMPYLVMEYVRGRSVQDRLDDRGALELKEVLRIGKEMAAGLAAAHAQGLVHRDIKPSNILLQDGVRVKITDFGLARAVTHAGSPLAETTASAVPDAQLSQAGIVAGTPQYMAPEQARGEKIDHRADLFSLGSVLYALCTGRAPFDAPTVKATIRQVSDAKPRPVREINPATPEWLAAVIAKLHAADPGQRYQSAAEIAGVLGRHLAYVEGPLTPHLRKLFGYDYRSRWRLWGRPLVHIATGSDPHTGNRRIARGIIAVGNVAIGSIAIGGLAMGGVAIGAFAFTAGLWRGCRRRRRHRRHRRRRHRHRLPSRRRHRRQRDLE